MKVKYIIDYKNYTYVECENEEEVKAVEEMNKNMEAFIKSEQRYNSRVISMNHLISNDGEEVTYELPDSNGMDIIDNLADKERIASIYAALEQITLRQNEVFLMVVVDGMSLRDIATKFGVHHKSIKETYDAAVKKIREICKNLI